MSEYDKLTELVLEKVEIAAQMHLSRAVARSVSVESVADHAARALVLQIGAYMWGNEVHREVLKSVRYPASWWQGFKASCFPDWLRRHYPVRYEEREVVVKFVHVCPHLDIGGDDQEVHLRFLAESKKLRLWDNAP